MRSARDLKALLLADLARVVESPSLYGGPESLCRHLSSVIGYLCFIDERREDGASGWVSPHSRFGPTGVPAFDGWFNEPGRRSSEAASLYAEVAHDLGYLEIDRRLDPQEWSALELGDLDRYRIRDWTMSEITGALPAPSRIVGRSVLCYAPPEGSGGWVFFDFFTFPIPQTDPLLRDLRLPTEKALDGLVLTPEGTTHATDSLMGYLASREKEQRGVDGRGGYSLEADRRAELRGENPVARRSAAELVETGRACQARGEFDAAVDVYEALAARFADIADVGVQEQVGLALIRLSWTLAKLGRVNDALAECDALARYAEATNPQLRTIAAKALSNKGVYLGRLGHGADALAAFDEVVGRYGDVEDSLTLQSDVSIALANKAKALERERRFEQALGVHNGIIARYINLGVWRLRQEVARAFLGKARALLRLGRHDEALAALDEVIALNDQPRAVGELIDIARVDRALVLSELGQLDDALAECDALVTRYGSSEEPVHAECTGRALLITGNILESLGRRDEATPAFEEIVARYRDTTQPFMRGLVAHAHRRAGGTLNALPSDDEGAAVEHGA